MIKISAISTEREAIDRRKLFNIYRLTSFYNLSSVYRESFKVRKLKIRIIRLDISLLLLIKFFLSISFSIAIET